MIFFPHSNSNTTTAISIIHIREGPSLFRCYRANSINRSAETITSWEETSIFHQPQTHHLSISSITILSLALLELLFGYYILFSLIFKFKVIMIRLGMKNFLCKICMRNTLNSKKKE